MHPQLVPSRFVAMLPLVALVMTACGSAFEPDAPLVREEAGLAAGNCLNLVAESGVTGAGPAGYTKCADEGGTCSFTQPVDVAYGANGGSPYRGLRARRARCSSAATSRSMPKSNSAS